MRIPLKGTESVLRSPAIRTATFASRYPMLRRLTSHLDRRLDAAAARFDEHAFVHAVTREGLLGRLEPMTIGAQHVLDLGSATGASIESLKKRFPKARVHAVDRSRPMLEQHRQGWFKRPSRIQADARQLPFQDNCIDVVFANLLLPFVDDIDQVFAEVARVLADGGVFAFASLGPDTFNELRGAWAAIDRAPHVADFPDMHDIGDLLVRAGLRDPVLDVDRLKVSYQRADTLFADLGATGGRNSLAGRPPGLMGRRRWQAFTASLFGAGQALELDLELVYGHAFGGAPMQARGPIAIDPASIGRRR